jgi:superfamily II DNA or RNA helicase
MNDKISGDIYIVNHQTLASFGKDESWELIHEFFKKISVGIKVVDEAHKFFRNTLLIDFFSNVKRSYYLTATFTRNDPKEVRIYNRAFSSCYRFGEETMDYDERRKHIIFIPVLYRSQPDFVQIRNIVNGVRGFNSYRYIDYALKGDPNHTMIKVLKKVIHKVDGIEGKILITSPKIESINMIADALADMTDRSIGCIYSKQSQEMNDSEIQKDIISTTIKGIGEGDNVKNIRVLINTEPIGSKGLADQLRGRLREYSPTEDTYMFYLIDTGIKYTFEMYKRIEPIMKRKCKEIIQINIDYI